DEVFVDELRGNAQAGRSEGGPLRSTEHDGIQIQEVRELHADPRETPGRMIEDLDRDGIPVDLRASRELKQRRLDGARIRCGGRRRQCSPPEGRLHDAGGKRGDGDTAAPAALATLSVRVRRQMADISQMR